MGSRPRFFVGIRYLCGKNVMQTIEIFKDTGVFVAGSTVRGPVADPSEPYAGFSLCTYTGDADSHTNACREALAGALGIPPANVIAPRQTHSSAVAVFREGMPVPDGVDALVCATPGYAIGVNTADCVPVLLADSTARIVGAAHAGWRGAAGGIIGETVAAMEALGADPQRMEAIVGACIHAECFEVGVEVAAQFPPQCVRRCYGARPHVDLVEAVRLGLLGAGVAAGNIAVAQGCTLCSPHRYFSARSLGVRSGRNFTFIMLR